MEKQIAKLKKQVRTLKETIKEMEYQRDKKAITEALDLNYYVIKRSELVFPRFEKAIKESKYLTAIDALYGLEKADALMKEGVSFENIARALDEVYLQSVKMRKSAPAEDEDEDVTYWTTI